jgi:hypothetical protein
VCISEKLPFGNEKKQIETEVHCAIEKQYNLESIFFFVGEHKQFRLLRVKSGSEFSSIEKA